MGATDDPKVLNKNRRQVVEDIEKLFPTLGFIGIGEIVLGGLLTAEMDPVKISRDMGPIMEALRARKAMITFPTGSVAFKGGLRYIYDLLWVDELAGNFPDVPIVLTKIGRKFSGSFDTCLVVANRNANVILDLTDSKGEHVRTVIDKVGARQVMFGTDLHVVSRNFAYNEGAKIVRDAKLSDEEWEWVAWRTANEVYRLNLR